jgi:tRNA (cmo5U34)-methyltransferase
MASQLNKFNNVATFYDLLVKVVFGPAMQKAQRYFLGSISDAAKVLIIGGGTGWIARDLFQLKPDAHVTYVEASEKMLNRAKKILKAYSHSTLFIHGTDLEVPFQTSGYDIIITNFFLDLFPNEKLGLHIAHSAQYLRENGQWIVTDFVDESKWWQRLMLWLMYGFFRITTGIEARSLPEWDRQIKENGLSEVGRAGFYGGFISTRLYAKEKG